MVQPMLPYGLTLPQFLAYPRSLQLMILQQMQQDASKQTNTAKQPQAPSNKPSLNDITGIAKNELSHSGIDSLLGGNSGMATNATEDALYNEGAIKATEQMGGQAAEPGVTMVDPGLGSYALPALGSIAFIAAMNHGVEGSARNMKANHGDLSGEDIAKGAYGDNAVGEAVGKLSSIPVIGPVFGSAFRPFIGRRTLAEDRRKKDLEAAGYKYLGDPESYSKSGHYDRWNETKKQYENDIQQYGADFVGNTTDGRFINSKFFKSRDEKDLTPQDILDNAEFAERFGNDWMEKLTPEQRTAIAKQTLDTGAVREHHGTVDVDWSKVGDLSSVSALSQPVKPTGPDAGTIKRWRENQGKPGFTGGGYKPTVIPVSPQSRNLPNKMDVNTAQKLLTTKDVLSNISKGGGTTRIAPDGLNRITTIPDGTEVSTLMGVVKPNSDTAKGMFEATKGSPLGASGGWRPQPTIDTGTLKRWRIAKANK